MEWTNALERIKEVLPWKREHGERVEVNALDKGAHAELVSDENLMTPLVGIYEGNEEFLVVADIPGANADTTRIHFQDRTLELIARAGPWLRREAGRPGEMEHGTWYRRFELPRSADGHRATASVHNGVLSIRVPKRPGPTVREIPVKAS